MPSGFEILVHVLFLVLKTTPTNTRRCEPGLFGPQCEFECKCAGGSATCDNGECKYGCKFGHIGPNCQFLGQIPKMTGKGRPSALHDWSDQTCLNKGERFDLEFGDGVFISWTRMTFNEQEQSVSSIAYGTDGKEVDCKQDSDVVLDDLTQEWSCFSSRKVKRVSLMGKGVKKLCSYLFSSDCEIGFWGELCDAPCPEMCIGGCDKQSGGCKKYPCPAGLKGANCMEGCDAGKYGMGCLLSCSNCMDERCNPMDGTCERGCKPGYQGSKCTEECDAGTYDQDCTARCSPHCENGRCNHINGTCVGGCKAGYTSDWCDHRCEPGTYGKGCTGKCRAQCRNQQCEATSTDGRCTDGCVLGYIPPLCITRCGIGTYGDGCSKTCSSHCKGGVRNCSPSTGSCYQGCTPGFMSNRCDKGCKPGTFGVGCKGKCSKHCKEKLCEAIDGKCSGGCEQGYMPPLCTSKCPKGKYGDGCSRKCSPHCIRAEKKTVRHCSVEDGRCLFGCQLGYKPNYCFRECGNGTYGKDCAHKCSSHCKRDICSAFNGACLYGCKPGYQLPDCKKECPEYEFGHHCAFTCSSRCAGQLCDHVTGNCLSCPPGAMGPRCSEPCPSGTFGLNCNDSCPANCSELCDGATGNCVDCTSAGKAGPKCDQDCPSGRFGLGCRQYCPTHCRGGEASCNPVDGTCKEGCEGNYKPPSCKICMENLHGENCSIPCSNNCLDGKCHPDTGACLNCPKGKRGATCSLECPPGYYGENCEQACNEGCFKAVCDMVTGHCKHCILGREGKFCQKEETDDETELKAQGGGALGPLLFVSAMVMLFFLLILVSKVQRDELRKRQLYFLGLGTWYSSEEDTSTEDDERESEVGKKKQGPPVEYKAESAHTVGDIEGFSKSLHPLKPVVGRSAAPESRPPHSLSGEKPHPEIAAPSRLSQSSKGDTIHDRRSVESAVDPAGVRKYSQTYGDDSPETSSSSDSDI